VLTPLFKRLEAQAPSAERLHGDDIPVQAGVPCPPTRYVDVPLPLSLPRTRPLEQRIKGYCQTRALRIICCCGVRAGSLGH
jgi:hypothetical protein